MCALAALWWCVSRVPIWKRSAGFNVEYKKEVDARSRGCIAADKPLQKETRISILQSKLKLFAMVISQSVRTMTSRRLNLTISFNKCFVLASLFLLLHNMHINVAKKIPITV